MPVIIAKMLRYSGLIILTVLFTAVFSSCHLNERLRSFRERLRIDDAIKNTKLIREAQSKHKQKFDKYGTLKDLIAAELLGFDFEDAEVSGSQFDLISNGEHYYLSVKPKVARSEEYILTLYLDETETIKFSADAQRPANSESHPIAAQ